MAAIVSIGERKGGILEEELGFAIVPSLNVIIAADEVGTSYSLVQLGVENPLLPGPI